MSFFQGKAAGNQRPPPGGGGGAGGGGGPDPGGNRGGHWGGGPKKASLAGSTRRRSSVGGGRVFHPTGGRPISGLAGGKGGPEFRAPRIVSGKPLEKGRRNKGKKDRNFPGGGFPPVELKTEAEKKNPPGRPFRILLVRGGGGGNGGGFRGGSRSPPHGFFSWAVDYRGH